MPELLFSDPADQLSALPSFSEIELRFKSTVGAALRRDSTGTIAA